MGSVNVPSRINFPRGGAGMDFIVGAGPDFVMRHGMMELPEKLPLDMRDWLTLQFEDFIWNFFKIQAPDQ